MKKVEIQTRKINIREAENQTNDCESFCKNFINKFINLSVLSEINSEK